MSRDLAKEVENREYVVSGEQLLELGTDLSKLTAIVGYVSYEDVKAELEFIPITDEDIDIQIDGVRKTFSDLKSEMGLSSSLRANGVKFHNTSIEKEMYMRKEKAITLVREVLQGSSAIRIRSIMNMPPEQIVKEFNLSLLGLPKFKLNKICDPIKYILFNPATDTGVLKYNDIDGFFLLPELNSDDIIEALQLDI